MLMFRWPFCRYNRYTSPKRRPQECLCTCLARARRWIVLHDRLHDRAAAAADDQPGGHAPRHSDISKCSATCPSSPPIRPPALARQPRRGNFPGHRFPLRWGAWTSGHPPDPAPLLAPRPPSWPSGGGRRSSTRPNCTCSGSPTAGPTAADMPSPISSTRWPMS